ncbi:MAG TPA: DUF4142 domain-containing protein [Steroidobacteraceae bacterium]|jgi:predicted outer membrane protein
MQTRSIRFKQVSAAALAALWLVQAPAALAQSRTSPGVTEVSPGAAAPNPDQAAVERADEAAKASVEPQITNDPTVFVKSAALGELTAIELAKLAQSKSQSANIQSFAARMLKDYGALRAELAAVARKQHLDVPGTLDYEDEQVVKQDSERTGADFDRWYVRQMRTETLDARALFEAATKMEDAELAAFAKKSLPLLEEHQEGVSVLADSGADATSCPPMDGLHFVCGPVAAEDLVQVPGTRWLISSGLNVGAPAHLYLIDTRDKSASPLFPVDTPRMALDRKLTPECHGPPDLSRLSTDGLALRPGSEGRHLLYAANHGDRVAIEVFEVDAAGERPQVSWVGCMSLPAHTLANSVAALPGEGILVTSFYDPTDEKQAWAAMARGENTGRLLEWHRDSGFHDVPGVAVSGANGVELNAEGTIVYVSAWSARKIAVVSRRAEASREIPLDFMPDNIHRLQDGSLLVGGQKTEVQKIAACGAQCPQPWVVVRVDPKSGAVTRLLEGKGTEAINYACGGIVVDNTLYVTARGDRRIIVAPMSH